jgi:hypothetical protein
MSTGSRVARLHGFKWTPVTDVQVGQVQWFAGHWLEVVAVNRDFKWVWLTYANGDHRTYSKGTQVGIRAFDSKETSPDRPSNAGWQGNR